MPTELTTPAMNALLADNVVGNISPQDMRDVMATALGGYASLMLSSAASPATKSTVGTTPLVITEYDTVLGQSIDANTGGCSANATTGLITVGQAGFYLGTFDASFTTAANNVLVTFSPFIDNVLAVVTITRKIGTGADVGQVSATVLFEATAGGEVIDMRVNVDAGTTDVIFGMISFHLKRAG